MNFYLMEKCINLLNLIRNMETKDITANNALILEFMGVKPSFILGKYQWSDSPFYYISYDNEGKTLQAMAEYAKYHKDWSWLMPCVERIESLEFIDREGRFNISSVCFDENYTAYVIDGAKGIIQVEGETKIEAVYNAVVQFIKWFNQNK